MLRIEEFRIKRQRAGWRSIRWYWSSHNLNATEFASALGYGHEIFDVQARFLQSGDVVYGTPAPDWAVMYISIDTFCD